MSYITRRLEEVFSSNFVQYIADKHDWQLTDNDVNLIFRRIAEYEQKNNVRFVTFFAKHFIIFDNDNT